MTSVDQGINHKIRVINYAKEIKNVSNTCRYYENSRETLYQWKRTDEGNGDQALVTTGPVIFFETDQLPLPKKTDPDVNVAYN